MQGDPAQNGRSRRAVLVTGAGGYVGKLLVRALASERSGERVVAMDVREAPSSERREGVEHLTLDIRSPEIGEVIRTRQVGTVVHLASIVSPPKGMDEATQRAIDVGGTRGVVEACLRHGVGKLVVTSSGAAYGYHGDNASLLTEEMPLRGNDEFAYSRHKRLVEEMLADYRQKHPELAQLVFRPGTILGETTSNQITDLFEKPVVVGFSDAPTPFNFVWDEDVVGCLLEGVRTNKAGTYNLIGDGVLTLREIASLLGKPFVGIPSSLMAHALRLLKRFGATQYGPEQVSFLRYRPVMSNAKLKEEFGFRPRKSSREVFELYRRGARARLGPPSVVGRLAARAARGRRGG